MLAAVSYVVVEDVAASWERYGRIADALSESAPAGLILHAAGPTDEGFRIVGVWESEEAWRSFAARLDTGADPSSLVHVFRALRPKHVIYGQEEVRLGTSTVGGGITT
jgi:hypothetical protein